MASIKYDVEKEKSRLRLQGKVAIVTGGASGIGEGIALELARQGANVAIADINLNGANKVAGKIKTLGVKSIAVKTDVTNFKDVQLMVRKVQDALGDIDILVNDAGGHVKGIPSTFLFDETEEAWDAMIALNLKSVFNCCRAVIGHMRERHYGKIVNIASVSGMVGHVRSVDYCAAKAGVIGFTMALAKEVGTYGINVNSVSPGPTVTPLTSGLITGQGIEKEVMTNATHLGRLGKPEDIAYAVAFLASDEASFITAQNLPVCGARNFSGGPDSLYKWQPGR